MSNEQNKGRDSSVVEHSFGKAEAGSSILPHGTKPLGVSNHAVLRYLERIVGIDLEAIRDEIRSFAYGSPDDAAMIVVENNSIVTVLGIGMRRRRKISGFPANQL